LLTHNISDLLPNTQYSYTFRAINSDNDTCKQTGSFTTLPISTTTFDATDITRSSAILHGTADFGDATVVKQGFVINNIDTVTVSNSLSALTYNIANIERATTYNYKTFCTTAGGTVTGAVKTFTTLAFNQNTDGAFLIENKEDLILLANLVNNGNSFSGQTFLLANDITLPNTPNNILSIGNKNTNRPFCGTFHGNGKRIYNVYIDEPNTQYQGFFGYTKNAYLYEVGLVNITASGRNYTGGMVGFAENTRISDSYVSGGTLFALSYCGGLVGYQAEGTNSIISGCYNTCTVTGNNYVGGLLGYSNQGTVRNSYTAALVTGQGNGVGAIIGGAQDVLNYNCYFNEETTGQSFAIGENNISSSSAPSRASSSAADGEGNMSSSEMRMQAFVNTLNQGLVTPVWKMDYNTPINNGFPILIWQTGGSGSGIENIEDNSIIIYPNPATEWLMISGEWLIKGVEIFDVSGKSIVKYFNQNRIDVSTLSQGIYLIKIETDKGIKTERFIKK
jgi:hypothetical protein